MLLIWEDDSEEPPDLLVPRKPFPREPSELFLALADAAALTSANSLEQTG